MILVLAKSFVTKLASSTGLSTIDIPSLPRLQIFLSMKLNGLCDSLSTEFPVLFPGGGGVE